MKKLLGAVLGLLFCTSLVIASDQPYQYATNQSVTTTSTTIIANPCEITKIIAWSTFGSSESVIITNGQHLSVFEIMLDSSTGAGVGAQRVFDFTSAPLRISSNTSVKGTNGEDTANIFIQYRLVR